MGCRKLASIVCMLLLAAAAGCHKEPVEAVAPKPKVVIETVAPRRMIDALTIPARLEPWVQVRLSAEVPGKLVYIAKEEGEAVTRGERLFGIEKATYQAQLAQAQASANYQVASAERCQRLFKQKAISRDELDKCTADRDVALAALEQAKAELAKTDIESPIDGSFDARLAEVGEYVGTGTALGDVVDTSRVKVVVPVPEKDVGFVHLGETIAVTVDAAGGDVRHGKVIFVKQVADPQTLTFPVHLEVANSDGRLRPGMIARVILQRHRIDNAVTVPLFAVVRRPSRYVVFVESDGVVHEREIALAFADDDRWAVARGLAFGDRLVVRGQRDLADGDAVEVAGTAGPDGEVIPVQTPEAAPDGESAAEASPEAATRAAGSTEAPAE